MNISLFKRKWRMFYKRAFITAFVILSFITIVDQGLSNALFARKIIDISTFVFALLNIFYFSIGSGLIAIIALAIMTIATKEN
ncbi:hypothetical protein N9W04_02330 [Alphaproteobacteria bacterium]|jgi:hypothetical protein|nr:hypothetical protein [Alphaproteobacteria bacterium]MDB2359677.1 hypothetical protein [Alphaproteobacteria bacterium]|tara:strand:+ start:16 stop:264 length:249 start_codon:yes stop_codon:yes gene_type:complete